MTALNFWKTIAMDASNFIEGILELLRDRAIPYCVIGGQAVNAYVEPLVSLDLDLVVPGNQLPQIEALMKNSYKLERFPHSLNVAAPGSALRVQFQTDPRYFDFVGRSNVRDVLGLNLPVASKEDVLQGKVWAVSDATRRASKRQKDLADINRLLEQFPEMRGQVPAEILEKLL